MRSETIQRVGGLAMSTETELINAINEFFSYLKQIDYESVTYTVNEFKTLSKAATPKWTEKQGVYYFVMNGEIQYVGKAQSVLLRKRITQQLKPTGEEWDKVTESTDTMIGIIAFEKEEGFWCASLEAYLIGKLSPTPFNKRLN
jgi:hypothetical protein